ncbi:MAG: hypothetical protein ACO1TE_08490 [Prosthecobacter sp.]
MKLPCISSFATALAATLLLGACAAPKVDPNVGMPTGIQYVIARYGDGGESHQVAARVQGMAVQYPRRPAFETAVMQQIRMGDLKVSKLEVTYVDGTARVFK